MAYAIILNFDELVEYDALGSFDQEGTFRNIKYLKKIAQKHSSIFFMS